jgi:hypothetical protein
MLSVEWRDADPEAVDFYLATIAHTWSADTA